MLQHPLENNWNFLFKKKSDTDSWNSEFKKIAKISYVEDFWAVYNAIPIPSLLPPGNEYYFFKTGISPDWGDPKVKNGGRWYIETNCGRADQIWESLLLACVGFQFEVDGLCGISLNVKSKTIKIFIWTSDINCKFGHDVRRILGTKECLQFVNHVNSHKNIFKI